MKRLFFYVVTILVVGLLPDLVFAADILRPDAVTNHTDLSIQYLEDIFGVVDGWLHGSGSQIMGQMFSVLNSGALFIGGGVVAYTLAVGTLNTAHEGQVLGQRWSSIWIPVRSAAGIALLLPKATGYSIIQIGLMGVVIQGIGLADSVWDAALNYLKGGGVIIASNVLGQTNYSPIIAQSSNILRSTVCVVAVQKALDTAYKNVNSKVIPAPPNLMDTVVPIVGTPYNNTILFPGDPSTNNPQYAIYAPLRGICGNVTLPSLPLIKSNVKVTAEMRSEIQQDQIVAAQQIILDMLAPAQTVVDSMLNIGPNATNPANTEDILPKATLFNSTQDYVGLIAPVERMLTQNLSSDVMDAITDPKTGAEAQGWLMAGAYYSTLAQINANAQNSIQVEMGPPKGSTEAELQSSIGGDGGNLAPKMPFGGQYAPNIANLFTQGVLDQYIGAAADFAASQYPNTPPPTYTIQGVPGNITFPQVTAPHFRSSGGISGAIAAAIGNMLAPPVTKVINDISTQVQQLIQSMNVFAILQQLANAQSTNENPIILIATLGSTVMNLVVGLVVSSLVSFAVASLPGLLEPGIAAISLSVVFILWSFLLPIIMALFLAGLAMFYYIPLIPFFTFFFSALGYFTNVIEGLVGSIAWALAFTHPEGEGLFSKYTEQGIGLVLSLFFIPSLMIVGFLAGYSLSYVAIWILNQGLFGSTYSMLSYVQEQANPSSITLIFGTPLFLVLYVTLVIMVLHQAFSLIHVIPDKVIRWLGMAGQTIGEGVSEKLSQARSGFDSGAGVAKESVSGAASSGVSAAKSIGKELFGGGAQASEKSPSSATSSSSSSGSSGDSTGSGSISVSDAAKMAAML